LLLARSKFVLHVLGDLIQESPVTDARFQNAAALLDEVAESNELEALVSAGTPLASEFRQNLRNLRGSLLRMPAVITLEEAIGQLDLLIFSATGKFAPFADKVRVARDAL
jgi:hypothetical protein